MGRQSADLAPREDLLLMKALEIDGQVLCGMCGRKLRRLAKTLSCAYEGAVYDSASLERVVDARDTSATPREDASDE